MLNKALPYIHEFIELIIKKGIEPKAVVLYGSFADNTASPISDIDLKIYVFDKNSENRILDIEKQINEKISKESFKFYIKSMVLVNEDIEHIEEGILLWGSPIRVNAEKKGLVKKKIITYNTTKLDQVKRAELVRKLFGYKTKKKIGKKDRVYNFNGSVKQLNAKRLRNGILIDDKSAKVIENILKEYNLDFHSSEIYLPDYAKFIEK
jgi:predicted nucleotidyltransferase